MVSKCACSCLYIWLLVLVYPFEMSRILTGLKVTCGISELRDFWFDIGYLSSSFDEISVWLRNKLKNEQKNNLSILDERCFQNHIWF